MFDLILKRKAFFISIAGILLMVFLVTTMRRKPAAPVPIAPPSQSPFEESIAASGIVESVGDNISLSAPVSGVIKNVLVKPGDLVKNGQVLVELDDRGIAGEHLINQANFDKISAHYSKVRKLWNTQALSREEFDTARYDYELAEAQLERTRLLLDQLKIRAPQDGIILQVSGRKGEYVATPMGGNPSEPAVIFGANTGIQIRADIDEVNASLVPKIPQAKALIRGSTLAPFDLTFLRIEPYVIPKRNLTGDNAERVDTRVLQVIFTAPARSDLYVGQQLDVYIKATPANPIEENSKK